MLRVDAWIVGDSADNLHSFLFGAIFQLHRTVLESKLAYWIKYYIGSGRYFQ